MKKASKLVALTFFPSRIKKILLDMQESISGKYHHQFAKSIWRACEYELHKSRKTPDGVIFIARKMPAFGVRLLSAD